MGNVKALEILADQDDIDIFVAAWNDGFRGPHIGKEIKLFAHPYCRRPVALGQRRRKRPLERKAGTPDACERLLGQRISLCLEARQASELPVPLKRRAESRKDFNGGFHDLRSDAIARNQGNGDQAFILRAH